MPRKAAATTTTAAPDPLAEYNAKRDFTRTAEPSGTAKPKRGKAAMLIVQKHEATRLHWDLRLEVDGVLKSWAVTRGPSPDPDDKRLAVRTEDHPLGYASFEGTIPKRDYGGGTVMLWDTGSWEPIPGKSADTLNDGHLHFIAHGQRMQGEWILIRLKPRPGEKRENWLLRKVADAHSAQGDVLVERCLTSVATGRTMEEIASGATPPAAAAPAKRKRRAKQQPHPAFRAPMLATLDREPPAGDDWLHEIKYDGYRCLIGFGSDGAMGWTRSGLDWTEKFAPVVAAAATLPAAAALLDGEVVALDGDGRPSFSELQAALKSRPGDLLYFAFDLIELDGEDWSARPLTERKARLAELLADAKPPLFYSDHVDDGPALLRTMAERGYEGIMSKRAASPYADTRSRDWLKVKVDRREEFVIVGWLPSDAKSRPFASLLLAQHEGETLVYKGRVGTGFDDAMQATLATELRGSAVKEPPVANPRAVANARDPRPKPQWVTPRLVAEVRFAEYTAEGVLRHASFMGLREDKPAAEVVAEVAVDSAAPNVGWTAPTPAIAISHPDRVVFGASGITKGQLASWYEAIAPRALAWVGDRPLSLVRAPDGIDGQKFFQKHLTAGFGKQVGSVMLAQGKGPPEPTIMVTDKAGLLRCVQMGTIEFHGWGARAGDVEHPDRLVIDLDPDEGLDFTDVKRAAVTIRDHLADLGLTTFPLLSGGKGVHVIAPLTPAADWDAVEDFAHRFARALEGAEPQRFVATMAKAKRKGRIFVDWLRNQRGSTAILPWSVRARDGAPVAVPVTWEMLSEARAANLYTLADPAAIIAVADALPPGWGQADQVLVGG